MPFDPHQFIKLVADTPEQIRLQDVYRLFDECPLGNRRDLAQYLAHVRPGLNDEVANVRAELGVRKISLRTFVRGGLLTGIYLLSPAQDLDVEVEHFDFDNLEESEGAEEEAAAAEKAYVECEASWSEIF